MKQKFIQFCLITITTFLACILSIQFFDKPITLFFYDLFYKSEPTFFTIFFDWISDGIYPTIPFFIFCFFAMLMSFVLRKWKFVLNFAFFGGTEIVVIFLTSYLKSFFARSRPFVFIENGDYTFYFDTSIAYYEFPKTSYAFDWCHEIGCYSSFPSGHTSSVFWLAFSAGLLYPKLRIPLFIYAFLIALARVFTTIHYLSDIIFGGFVAFFVVYLSYELLIFLYKKFNL